MDLTVEIDDKQVQSALSALLSAVERPEPALKRIGATLTDNIRLGFHDSQDPYGRPWKAVLRESGQPLRDAGNLMDSFTYRVTDNEVVVGSALTVEYDGRRHNLAAIHQYGATIRPVKAKALRFVINGRHIAAQKVTIPPRKMIPDRGLPDEWRDDVLDILQRHLAAA